MTTPPSVGDLTGEVLSAGRRAGLDRVGTCDAAPFEQARAALVERAAAGLSGGMQFTYRNPDRSTDPSRTLPGARSLVVGALGYAAPVPERPTGAQGRVARYASTDHYARLREGLTAMADVLSAAGHQARVLADDNALVDRAAAVRAGLGWYGRSANVLLPGRGSWFVLGSVLTDAPLGPRPEPVADGCGTCTRCIDHCPTGAIVAPGVVDARRCLAWHVQQEGELPHEFRVALDDRMYGCDECQEVCPPSRRDEASAVGQATGTDGDVGAPGSWVDLMWVLGADDAALMERLGRWYVARRDPRHLRRNALVALGNSVAAHHTVDPHDVALEAMVTRYLDGPDDLLASHAAWAALRMGRGDLLEHPARARRAAVSGEMARWPGGHAHREDGRR
jgi:epoxyqueuosine reductase